MRILLMFLFFLLVSTNAKAQELGILGTVLNDDCQKYLETSQEIGHEYDSFCAGYVESVIEHKQFIEEKDIFSCFPTYGDYDPFKVRVVLRFMEKYTQHKKEGNKYVRAFNLVRESVEEELKLKCIK